MLWILLKVLLKTFRHSTTTCKKCHELHSKYILWHSYGKSSAIGSPQVAFTVGNYKINIKLEVSWCIMLFCRFAPGKCFRSWLLFMHPTSPPLCTVQFTMQHIWFTFISCGQQFHQSACYSTRILLLRTHLEDHLTLIKTVLHLCHFKASGSYSISVCGFVLLFDFSSVAGKRSYLDRFTVLAEKHMVSTLLNYQFKYISQ